MPVQQSRAPPFSAMNPALIATVHGAISVTVPMATT
jgi:hypothetical protein